MIVVVSVAYFASRSTSRVGIIRVYPVGRALILPASIIASSSARLAPRRPSASVAGPFEFLALELLTHWCATRRLEHDEGLQAPQDVHVVSGCSTGPYSDASSNVKGAPICPL